MINFILHHWYDLGVISGLLAYRYYYVNKRTLSIPQKLLLANFIALCIHQFEEYRFPGGFPTAMNLGVHHSTAPDRYPLNAWSSLLTNVPATYGVYLPAIFFPEVTGLGLTTVIFGFAQFYIHGINMNLKLGTIYNPGLASVVFGFIPIGLKYVLHMQNNGLLTRRDWIIGFIGTWAFSYLLIAKTTFGLLPDYNTSYPFSPAEMQRWGANLVGLA
ncbi:hypothetical protein INT44_006692 [Umbelopsis vinacea]|uniref:HXXEE domain-containing protein n=1 Tax=Umbelopsis vinacea TaxID=44442 RepID=A0A8H7PDI2_9FUNG|nr:hypothetical protein INT44_006692 [Umbelopsis vinacea]